MTFQSSDGEHGVDELFQSGQKSQVDFPSFFLIPLGLLPYLLLQRIHYLRQSCKLLQRGNKRIIAVMELEDGDFGASKFDEWKKYQPTLPREAHHDEILIREEDAVNLPKVGVVVVGYAVMLLERSVVF